MTDAGAVNGGKLDSDAIDAMYRHLDDFCDRVTPEFPPGFLQTYFVAVRDRDAPSAADRSLLVISVPTSHTVHTFDGICVVRRLASTRRVSPQKAWEWKFFSSYDRQFAQTWPSTATLHSNSRSDSEYDLLWSVSSARCDALGMTPAIPWDKSEMLFNPVALTNPVSFDSTEMSRGIAGNEPNSEPIEVRPILCPNTLEAIGLGPWHTDAIYPDQEDHVESKPTLSISASSQMASSNISMTEQPTLEFDSIQSPPPAKRMKLEEQ